MAYPAEVTDRFTFPQEYGATLVYRTKTRIEAASAGYERRERDYTGEGRRTWTGTYQGAATYAGATVPVAKAIWDFFQARRGRAQGFVAMDPEDLVWKRVRFTDDRLVLRRVGWDEYTTDLGLSELWPGGTVAPLEGGEPEGVIVPPESQSEDRGLGEAVPQDLPTFPDRLSLGAEVWVEFKTQIVSRSDGNENRVAVWGANWRAGASVSYTVLEQAEAHSALTFYYDRKGPEGAFYFNLPGLISTAMRFATDAAELPRPGPETLGLRLEMVSCPPQGEF